MPTMRNGLILFSNVVKGEDKSEYDIVIGGIADDKIFKTIDLLTFISAEEITK